MTFIPPTTTAQITSVEAWHGDGWNELDYGRSFDFSRPFFEQFRELVEAVPLIALANIRCENSPYANCAAECKNCHLLGGANNCEDCFYGNYVNRSRSCVENTFIDECELCYECIDCRGCYRLRWGQNCSSCSDSWFLYSCRNVSYCFGCVNLVNAKYCVFNRQLSEAEYFTALARFDLASRASLERVAQRFDAFRLTFPHRAFQGERLEEVSGSSISNSRRCTQCFDATALEDCHHCTWLHSARDCMDIFSWGLSAELCYECVEVGDNSYGIFCSSTTWSSTNIAYCYLTKGSHDCFGSVGLRGRAWCILNTQYSESEYHRLMPRIVAHMRECGEWGEFFPMGLSPHAYNTAISGDYFPLQEDVVRALGAKWYTAPAAEQAGAVQVAAVVSSVPDSVAGVNDELAGRTFNCSRSGKPFKFIVPELRFYHTEHLPLPDVSFQERHRRRLRRRAPRDIWSRSCAKCGNAIFSVFAPERPEIVWCPDCFSEAMGG